MAQLRAEQSASAALREQVPQISADEPLAAEFSLENAQTYLANAATSWTASRQCVTCHTNGLYLLSASPGAQSLRETQQFARSYLERLVDDQKQSAEANRSIEGIVATTTLLAISESRSGNQLDPITRRAFDYIWTRQSEQGCWDDWLKCNWPPYEVDDHFGVTLVALAMGHVPESYRNTPQAQRGLQELRRYLSEHPPETAHQRAMLLWASTVTHGILDADQQQRVVHELLELQNDDGGWNLISLGPQHQPSDPPPTTWVRTDGRLQDTESSDGYATGLIVYILRQSGVAADEPRIQRSVAWLKSHQRASGRWFTRSPRKDSKHFISNAGTSFALLALKSCAE